MNKAIYKRSLPRLFKFFMVFVLITSSYDLDFLVPFYCRYLLSNMTCFKRIRCSTSEPVEGCPRKIEYSVVSDSPRVAVGITFISTLMYEAVACF
jgi:hypothetical protein